MSSHQLLIIDVASSSENISATDSGVGTEAVTIKEVLAVSDSGVGSEAALVGEPIAVVDAGVGAEAIAIGEAVLVSDVGLGIDTTYTVQGQILIDDVALPHVLGIDVQEPSIVREWPIREQVPVRKQIGKEGRSITIQGWTDSLSTLETLRGYADGEKHLLILPTGDSMNVYITDIRTPENVEKYNHYDYELDAVEVID